MYFSKLKLQSEDDSEAVWNLILEVVGDVHQYENLTKEKNESDMLETWRSLSQGYDVAHSTIQDSMASSLLGAEVIKLGDGKIKPETAFANTFKTFRSTYETMAKMITLEGNKVRVSRMGGYSPHDEMYEEIETKVFSEKRFYSWLMREGSSMFMGNKDPVEDYPKLTKPNVIIENQNYCSREFMKEVEEILKSKPDYHITLNNFKMRTKGYEEDDFKQMIIEWLNDGLEKVFVETTMKDKNQFYLLVDLLIGITNELDKKIDFYLMVNQIFHHKMKKKFKDTNVKLTLL